MKLRGHISNGVVVLDEGSALPEGVPVTVVYEGQSGDASRQPEKRIQLPLVSSKQPGALRLTPEDAASALEEEDVAAGC